MIADIDINGTLIIKSENALESYAIRRYCEENLHNLPIPILFIHDAKNMASDIKTEFSER